MSTATDFLAGNSHRPHALGIDAALQQIASAAHLRGVRTTRQDIAVGELPAAELLRVLRAALAHAMARPQRAAQVEAIIRGTAARLKRGGPVAISRSALGIVTSYAAKARAG